MNLLYITLGAFIVVVNSLNVKLPQTQNIFKVFEWKDLEFNLGSNPGRYNTKPASAVPVDLQPAVNKGKLVCFLTIPRLTADIPFTLARIEDQASVSGPKLLAYPKYDSHNHGTGLNCDGITSAHSVAVNQCNQMWVIDSGVVGHEWKCPPQLLLFDLNTDQLIHRYRFNSTLYKRGLSFFTNVVVNVRNTEPRGHCRNSVVYVADTKEPGFVVYDVQRKSAWRFTNPDPHQELQSIAAAGFTSMNGIGMVTDKAHLYFHSFLGVQEYRVPLNALDSIALAKKSVAEVNTFFEIVTSRRSACTASAIDSRKMLYCFSANPTMLTAWNIADPNPTHRIIELPVSKEEIHFVSGLKVVKNQYDQETLFILSNNQQKPAAGMRNSKKSNFFILSVPVVDTPI